MGLRAIFLNYMAIINNDIAVKGRYTMLHSVLIIIKKMIFFTDIAQIIQRQMGGERQRTTMANGTININGRERGRICFEKQMD